VIKYSLICDKKHAFEGWFSSGEDFDAQKKRNLVTCPFCDSSKIEKTLMAPSVFRIYLSLFAKLSKKKGIR